MFCHAHYLKLLQVYPYLCGVNRRTSSLLELAFAGLQLPTRVALLLLFQQLRQTLLSTQAVRVPEPHQLLD